MKRFRHGFTLLEIMIAMCVVALLLSLLAPNVSKVRVTIQKKQAEVDLELIAQAVLNLAWDTGKWPRGYDRSLTPEQMDVELWNLRGKDAGLVTADSRFPNWKGPYLKSVPKDPWGNDYFFDLDYYPEGQGGGRPARIAVGSFGPNTRGRNIYDDDNIFVLLDE